jgi:hypothetical protein
MAQKSESCALYYGPLLIRRHKMHEGEKIVCAQVYIYLVYDMKLIGWGLRLSLGCHSQCSGCPSFHSRVGSARIMDMYGVYTVFLAGKLQIYGRTRCIYIYIYIYNNNIYIRF